jgi:type IV secretory pathway VirB9-like protein
MIPILFPRKNVLTVGCLVLLLLSLAPEIPATTTEGARVVTYSREDIIPVRAKLRYSTLIVLPDNEEILDFTTGDKEFWIINGAHNLCYVHPAQAGIRSNLNLITTSGHVYSFLLTEISSEPNVQPDLKLFVDPRKVPAPLACKATFERAKPRLTRKNCKRFANKPSLVFAPPKPA